jgi:hypothetical protein
VSQGKWLFDSKNIKFKIRENINFFIKASKFNAKNKKKRGITPTTKIQQKKLIA